MATLKRGLFYINVNTPGEITTTVALENLAYLYNNDELSSNT